MTDTHINKEPISCLFSLKSITGKTANLSNRFTSKFAKSEFYAAYAHATKKGKDVAAIETYSDTGNGVAYKVRAVLDAYGQWIPLIRCGHTGQIIWETNLTQETWQEAMAMALGKLHVMLVDSDFDSIWGNLISASKNSYSQFQE